MKKLLVALMTVGLAVFGLSGAAFAYHNGGVAYCEGCHTMHNSYEGSVITTTTGGYAVNATPAYLLKGTDQSSTCLNCHNGDTNHSYHVSTTPSVAIAQGYPNNFTPGGDFAWLKLDFAKVGYGSASPGERHGHNINAADYGYVPDSTQTVAPGGTYPANRLACSSCHDPHGKYRYVGPSFTLDNGTDSGSAPIIGSGSYYTGGSALAAPLTATEAIGTYRLLPGAGYVPKSLVDAGLSGLAFTSDPPVALAPGTYNQSYSIGKVYVEYGKNMSEFCANCHTGMLENNYTSGMAGLRHPAGNSAVMNVSGSLQAADNYNAYVKTGDLSGTSADSYNPLVPFERQMDETALEDAFNANLGGTDAPALGPDGSSNVMCLTCHRAHASGFNSMTRWNNNEELITEDGAYNIDYARSLESVEAAYYNTPVTDMATYQRSLCNKCHIKD